MPAQIALACRVHLGDIVAEALDEVQNALGVEVGTGTKIAVINIDTLKVMMIVVAVILCVWLGSSVLDILGTG